jgi:hypothetical protein
MAKAGIVGSVDIRLNITAGANGSPYLSAEGMQVLSVDISTAVLEQIKRHGLSEGDDFAEQVINGAYSEDQQNGVFPVALATLARRPNSSERMSKAK